MNNDLISREALKEAFKAWKTMDDYYHNTDGNDIPFSEAFDLIDNAPSEQGQFEEKVIELFNKYDPLLLHIGKKIEPVKNTSKQDCYNLLYEIGELFEWRRVLFKKYHGGNE